MLLAALVVVLSPAQPTIQAAIQELSLVGMTAKQTTAPQMCGYCKASVGAFGFMHAGATELTCASCKTHHPTARAALGNLRRNAVDL